MFENIDVVYLCIIDGGFNDNNYWYLDFWMCDGCYICLRNVNLSYFIFKLFFERFRGFDEVWLFVIGYNLFVLKNFEEEFDL